MSAASGSTPLPYTLPPCPAVHRVAHTFLSPFFLSPNPEFSLITSGVQATLDDTRRSRAPSWMDSVPMPCSSLHRMKRRKSLSPPPLRPVVPKDEDYILSVNLEDGTIIILLKAGCFYDRWLIHSWASSSSIINSLIANQLKIQGLRVQARREKIDPCGSALIFAHKIVTTGDIKCVGRPSVKCRISQLFWAAPLMKLLDSCARDQADDLVRCPRTCCGIERSQELWSLFILTNESFQSLANTVLSLSI